MREDLGKLILRISIGGLLLFHGIFKITHGIGFLHGLLEAKGWPTFLAYGAYVGEVVAPILVILGVLTRLGGIERHRLAVQALRLFSGKRERADPAVDFDARRTLEPCRLRRRSSGRTHPGAPG